MASGRKVIIMVDKKNNRYATMAVIASELEAIKGVMVEIKQVALATSEHVSKAMNDINVHTEMIKAVDIKAERALLKAQEAKKIADGHLRWVITLVIGNLVMYAGLILLITTRFN